MVTGLVQQPPSPPLSQFSTYIYMYSTYGTVYMYILLHTIKWQIFIHYIFRRSFQNLFLVAITVLLYTVSQRLVLILYII